MRTVMRGRFTENGPWTWCDRAELPGHGEGCTCAMEQNSPQTALSGPQEAYELKIGMMGPEPYLGS